MDCAAGLTGIIVRPGDPGYDSARMEFNTRFSKFPCAIAFCQRTRDVVNAVNKARKNHIPIRARSGRHSYEAFSVVNDGIVADLSDMTDVRINSRNNTAVVQTGIGLLDFYEQLWRHGFAFPGGTCPKVGIAGLTLGGGFGMLARLYGLACDNMLSLEMVNANGKTISADEHRNAELLWASRGGGGGNFGIVTSFCVKVYPISQVAIYDISWKWKDAAKVISAWQELTPYTDERLGADLRVRSRQDGTVNATGQFVGSQFEMERLLRPLIKSATPTNVDIRTVPYIEAARKFDGVRPPHKFKNTGANVYANLSPKAIKTMLAFLRNPPSKDNLVEFQSLNGAVSRIGPRATAYFHRSAIYNLQYIAQWMHNDEQEANIEWVNALRQALVPYTVGTYVNYPDLDIINWPEAYYGANLEQLKAVKRKYDPENLFNFPQSIPLA